MKRELFFYCNCAAQGLTKFLAFNPAFEKEFNCSYVENYMVQEHLIDKQEVYRGWEKADVIFYQWLAPDRPINDPTIEQLIPFTKKGAIKYAISAPHNNGYWVFYASWSQQLKDRVRQYIAEHGLSKAVDHYWLEGDLDWQSRYEWSLNYMKDKEENEGVDPAARVSDLFQSIGREKRLLIVANHPSSWMFYLWALRLTKQLGLEWNGPGEEPMAALCNNYPNFTNLPCEDSVTPSARLHLGLKWGVEEAEKSRIVVANALAELMQEKST